MLQLHVCNPHWHYLMQAVELEPLLLIYYKLASLMHPVAYLEMTNMNHLPFV